MSQLDTRAAAEPGGTAADRTGLLERFTGRVRGGDLGALPVIGGVIAIWAVFAILNDVFLSSRNLVNLATDSAAIGVIALGIVFVLLVAQIDLSVGSISGVAAAVLAVGMTQLGWPSWLAMTAAIGLGLLAGLIYGWIFVRFDVHTFVITLAGLLTLLGFQLWVLSTHGSINIPFDTWIVRFMQQMFIPKVASYIIVALIAAGFLASRLARRARRLAHNLPVRAVSADITVAVTLLVALEAGCWYLNRDRGISAPFAFFVVLVFIAHFALTRTSWGRAIVAVGGSVEAARRAGINVKRIFVSAIVICTVLAAVGGLLEAGRLAAATTSSGTADVNLDAIAAAVIGGTSLFGGRGSAYSALLGIIVIQSIASGLTLINLSASVRFMITGGVLLIAVIVDAVTRKTRAMHGRA
jgi:simple sugar transport system permease protein/D-xylose transport system permease protein